MLLRAILHQHVLKCLEVLQLLCSCCCGRTLIRNFAAHKHRILGIGIFIVLVLVLEAFFLKFIVVEQLIDTAKISVFLITNRLDNFLFGSLLESRRQTE